MTNGASHSSSHHPAALRIVPRSPILFSNALLIIRNAFRCVIRRFIRAIQLQSHLGRAYKQCFLSRYIGYMCIIVLDVDARVSAILLNY
jgi:hypothetical protein